MNQLTYRILLNNETEGGFTVSVPALPGCVTYGDTIDEARSMAKEAIEGYIEALEDDDLPVPDELPHLEVAEV